MKVLESLMAHMNYFDEVFYMMQGIPKDEFGETTMAGLSYEEREALAEQDDPVNHPTHYTQGGIECIDAIEAALGREGFIAFLRGQVIKYQWRLGAKGPVAEDNAKAAWYCNKLAEVLSD